jgi:hypothetical protein
VEEGADYSIDVLLQRLSLDNDVPWDIKEASYRALQGGSIGALFGGIHIPSIIASNTKNTYLPAFGGEASQEDTATTYLNQWPSLEKSGDKGYTGNGYGTEHSDGSIAAGTGTVALGKKITDNWYGIDTEGDPTHEGAGENLKSPNTFNQFNTYGDALRENLGPAYQSHKAEYDDILNQAKEHGVEITFRKGTLAYEPSLTAGRPGRLILDPDASVGALRHEFKHLLDDAAMGHPGFQIMADRDAFWELERRGYMEELNLARQLKDTKAEELILHEMQERMKEIFGRE